MQSTFYILQTLGTEALSLCKRENITMANANPYQDVYYIQFGLMAQKFWIAIFYLKLVEVFAYDEEPALTRVQMRINAIKHKRINCY